MSYGQFVYPSSNSFYGHKCPNGQKKIVFKAYVIDLTSLLAPDGFFVVQFQSPDRVLNPVGAGKQTKANVFKIVFEIFFEKMRFFYLFAKIDIIFVAVFGITMQ